MQRHGKKPCNHHGVLANWGNANGEIRQRRKHQQIEESSQIEQRKASEIEQRGQHDAQSRGKLDVRRVRSPVERRDGLDSNTGCVVHEKGELVYDRAVLVVSESP